MEIHNHLNDMIDGFDQQVEQVLEKQELDFIAAYRVSIALMITFQLFRNT
jgi:hypothetical protein